MNYHRQDMFYDNPSFSPNPNRLQGQGSLHQSPRPVDSAANSISGFYQSDDQPSRFENPRFNERMTAATLHGNFGPYDMGAQTWNGGAFGGNGLGSMGGTRSMKPPSRGRSALPTNWMDQAPPMPAVSPFLGLGGGHGSMGMSPHRGDMSDMDEELIPTAIVIKNIPFAVKKEQLVAIMTDLGLPLPYAFNYHFDNGIFRGLAFANFTSADETASVIDALNHFELQGRKLRVEYKKMLPAQERERIEREKRERRGQLEEQHRPMPGPTLQTQPSISSLSNIPATSPSPVSARGGIASAIDMNDPETLEFYTKLAVFKERPDEVYMLPPNLTPQQRRTVHTLAHHMGLAHMSKGVGEQRAVHVYKQAPVERLSPPVPQLQALGNDQRRTLSRAATTDFNDARNQDSGLYGLRQQVSSGFLPPSFQNPNSNLSASQNLRAAKSFADLRSYTPSPVPSTASFPTSLTNNVQRIQEQGREAQSATTPTMPNSAGGFGGRDEGLLVNGLGNLNLGNGFGNSPRTLRGMASWDRGNEALGAIGGHRSFTTGGPDSQSGDRNQNMPSRQPRGPASGTGFSRGRQNGHMSRGSDELSQQSVTVESATE
ncbi:RNA-binding post-transcriptional regulator cip2 [Elsinoe australis]|uniref:RNA-binding post-transcriptional regulator cip2 n=1 Tax=Elsinoe australis TaxID=40998 RepID=A0A2P8A7Z8_9PEZI|nr:RNA-binding post-transcriptional regulator cip2 [Elsinoe australis]